MSNYLDESGVSYLWDRTKTIVDDVLPSVTQSDDGKILKVDSGEWIVGEASRDTFLVTLTRNPITYKLESDKTPAEIGEAVDAGKSILINKNTGSPVDDGIYYATYANTSGGILTKLLGYSRIDQVYNGDRHCRYHTIDEIKFTTGSGWVLSSQKTSLEAYESTGQNSGDSTMTQKAITDAIDAVLPTVTASDEGKILKVNSSGVWTIGNDAADQYIITLSSTGDGWTVNRTPAEVTAAYSDQKQLVFQVPGSVVGFDYPFLVDINSVQVVNNLVVGAAASSSVTMFGVCFLFTAAFSYVSQTKTYDAGIHTRYIPTVIDTWPSDTTGLVLREYNDGNNAAAAIPAYSTTGNNTDGTMTQAAITEASQKMIETTYADLVDLVTNHELIPGMRYRIIDYVTTITGYYDLQELGASGKFHYADSAEHPFDIIVTADSDSTLNENAKATYRDNDSYFMNCNLEPWELKYTIYNSSRYLFSDPNGKGVIYWMKDEYGNEAGYDFKNVRFLRYAASRIDQQSDMGEDLEYDNSSRYYRYMSPFDVMSVLMDYLDNPSEYVYSSPLSNLNLDFSVGGTILNTISYDSIDSNYLNTFNAGLYYTFDAYDHSDESRFDLTVVAGISSSITCSNNKLVTDTDIYAGLFASVNFIGLDGNVFQVDITNTPSRIRIVDNKFSSFSYYNTIAVYYNNICYNNSIGGIGCFIVDSRNIKIEGNLSFADFTVSNAIISSNNVNIASQCAHNYVKHTEALRIDCNSDSNVVYNSSGCIIGCYNDDNKIYLSDNCIFESDCHSNELRNSSHNTFRMSSSFNSLDYSGFNEFIDSSNNVLGQGCDWNKFNGASYVLLGYGSYGHISRSSFNRATYITIPSPSISSIYLYYLNIGERVSNITIPVAELSDKCEVVQYTGQPSSGYATIIKKTGFGIATARQTTDGGTTWTTVNNVWNGGSY